MNGLFFSAEHAGKMATINDMAQLWGLPPSLTLEGTPSSLEEAQGSFVDVFSLSLNIIALTSIFV